MIGKNDAPSSAASLAALAALLVFHAFQLKDYCRRETRPPAWDQSIQLETAMDLRSALARGDYAAALLANAPKPGMPPFPPLYGLSLLPFGGGADAHRALWSNWLHLALLCLALWGIGRRIGGPWVGLACAALFSCVPEVQSLLRQQLVDLALTAWVAAAYWALIGSEGLRRRRESVLFGLLFAAAMLAKWSAFSYFLPALFFFPGALRDHARRKNALWAAAAAALLCGPWYLSQLPILLPRLVEASADQATAVWKGAAALTYPRQMGEGLEFPLWALGIAALFLPGGRGDAQDRRLLKVWTLSSLVFWTLVPNRQLRYLLPGLPPLALLFAAWRPGLLTWTLCAYQALSALNSTRAWIPRVQAGPLPAYFFVSETPKAEDWKLGDILQEAASRHDPSIPFGNITLVANHPQFNPTNLHWTRLSRRIDTLRVRGVNGRICEFSEFLVVKTRSLGPPSVVNQLPGVQSLVLDPSGWFQRGYREVRRFPLPDGSHAMLFQRKPPAKAPFPVRDFRFPAYAEGNFSADDLHVDFGAYDAAKGVYPKVRLSAKRVRIRGLAVDGVEFLMEDLSLIPTQQTGGLQDVRFLGMKRLSLVSGSVSEKALAAFLESRVNGLEHVSASFSGGEASSSGTFRGIRVACRVGIALAQNGSSLTITAKSLKVAGITIPVGLLGRRASYTRDFRPDAELPFELDVPSISVSDGFLTILSGRLDSRISVSLVKGSLASFFDQVAAQSKLRFMLIGNFSRCKVTAFLRNVTARETLQLALQIKGLTYQQIGRSDTYVASPRSPQPLCPRFPPAKPSTGSCSPTKAAPIALDCNDGPMSSFARIVSDQSDTSFFFADGAEDYPITAELKGATRQTAMEAVLKDGALAFKGFGRSDIYVVSPRNSTASP